jgi:hypothetical protein
MQDRTGDLVLGLQVQFAADASGIFSSGPGPPGTKAFRKSNMKLFVDVLSSLKWSSAVGWSKSWWKRSGLQVEL